MSLAFPYLRPSSDVVTAGPWARSVSAGSVELPQRLDDWDYSSVLSLGRILVVDGLRARKASGLGEDAELALTVRWSASASLLRGNAWQQLLPAQDGIEIPVDFDLPGDELGGVLSLTTLITMTRAGSHPSPAAPRRPGSILWSDEDRVALQGDEALFPIAQADFQDLPHPDKASWYLEIGEELDAAAMGSLLLLVNERRPVVLEALANASSPSPTNQAVLSVLRADILRTLIERALVDDDFDEEADYPAGSLGATLRHVIRGTFETEDFESLRREREQQPGFFTTRIQAAADMLAGS